MAIINLTVLKDILGGTTPVNATLTATVNRALYDSYRIDGENVIFPNDIDIQIVNGEPTAPFELSVLPANYYWHITIFTLNKAPLRRSVIVPGNAGPYDFDELIDVVPETALPDAGTDAATAYAALIESYATRAEYAAGIAEGGGVSADIADFTFTNNGDYELGGEVNADSEISLHNKDFSITTTRDVLTQEQIDQFGNIDADINLTAADDIFIRAEGDDVSIAANSNVTIRTDDNNASYTWDFNSDGTFYLPAGTDIVDGFEVVDVQGSRSIAAEVDYLSNSPTNNSTAVYLTLDQDSTWMSYNFANKVTSTITFGDSATVDLVAIYEADLSGTTVVVFQWETSRDVIWPVLIEQTATEPETRRSLTLNVPLTTDAGVENSAWRFDSDGSLTIPGSGRIVHDTGDIVFDADGQVYIGSSDFWGNQVVTYNDMTYVEVGVPASSLGQEGNVVGHVADDSSYHYYCTGNYDGVTHIWKRIAWSSDTW